MIVINQERFHKLLEGQTGCPKQEKMIPPMAAETITTTKSEISLQTHIVAQTTCH